MVLPITAPGPIAKMNQTMVRIQAIGLKPCLAAGTDEVSARNSWNLSLCSLLSPPWVIAEIILFVLIGAALDVTQLTKIGLSALLIIAIGLIGRSIGVWISLFGSDLNFKEKLFCVLSYTPKATVQAAIGAIPLSVGIGSGEIILAIAVLSIVITAPIGSILIKTSAGKLLKNNEGQ